MELKRARNVALAASLAYFILGPQEGNHYNFAAYEQQVRTQFALSAQEPESFMDRVTQNLQRIRDELRYGGHSEYLRDFRGAPNYTMCREGDPFYDNESEVSQKPVITISKPVGEDEKLNGDLLGLNILDRFSRSNLIEKDPITMCDIVGEYGQPEFDENGELVTGISNVLLVPVGYDDSDKLVATMEDLKGVLEQSFDGLPISFSYMKRSTQLGVSRQGHRAIVDDEDMQAFKDEIAESTGQTYDRILVLPDSDDYMGRNYTAASVSAGDNDHSYYLAVHELGHNYGLDDRYLHNLGEGGIRASTEFTLDPALTDDPTLQWALDLLDDDVQVFPIDASCQGKVVYSFYPYREPNVMNNAPHNNDFFEQPEDMFPFNPLQRAYMWKTIYNDTQERLLSKK